MSVASTMRVVTRLAAVAVVLTLGGLPLAGAASNWAPSLAAGSKGQSAAQAAITTATGNPVTFTAACVSSSSESAVLTWTSAGTAVTGYQVLVSSTVGGTFALDATQPTGTSLTVTETYFAATGNKFYRLEAKSASWPFPGTTITNARQAAVLGTNGGWLTMATSGTRCTATP